MEARQENAHENKGNCVKGCTKKSSRTKNEERNRRRRKGRENEEMRSMRRWGCLSQTLELR